MIRIHAAITRKQGLPRYSSVQASCGIDAEFDAGLVHDAERMAETIRGLYRSCEQSVDEELARIEEALGHPDDPSERAASPAQLRALRALARERKIDLAAYLERWLKVPDELGLTSRQASLAIDRLRGLWRVRPIPERSQRAQPALPARPADGVIRDPEGMLDRAGPGGGDRDDDGNQEPVATAEGGPHTAGRLPT